MKETTNQQLEFYEKLHTVTREAPDNETLFNALAAEMQSLACRQGSEQAFEILGCLFGLAWYNTMKVLSFKNPLPYGPLVPYPGPTPKFK